MTEITCSMISPCGNMERMQMEMYVEQANGINHCTNWSVLEGVREEIMRKFPNQAKVIDAIHSKVMSLYHEEEYYADQL